MSERDAFGRGQNQDTLAGMGWREPRFTATIAGAEATRAPVLPETAEMPDVAGPTWSPPAPRPAPVSGRTRPRRGPRAMTRLLLLGIVAAAILFGLREGTDVLGDIEDAIRGQTGAITRTVPVEGGSLLRASALEAALEGLPGGDVEVLRVAPDRLDAQVIVDGRMHNVRVTAGGRVFDLPTPGDARGAPVRVDARAPARIVRTATRRAGRRPGSVSYLVLMNIAGRSEWQLFFEDGLHFSGSASGRTVRRISG